MKIKHFSLRLQSELLTQDESKLNQFLETVEVKQTNMEVVTNGAVSYWSVLVGYEAMPQEETKQEGLPPFDASTLSDAEIERYEALRKWRNKLADSKGFIPYQIANNRQLGEIAQINPTQTEQLSKVKGLGQSRMWDYGEGFISILNSFR